MVEIKTSNDENPSRQIRERGENCFAELGSLTAAMKAQEVLAAAAIPANVEKIEAPASHRGCVYGIRISCLQERNASSVLKNARIAVKRWNGEH